MNEKVGHVSFDMTESMVKPYSEAPRELVDPEVRTMIQEAMDRTMKVLEENRDLIIKLAEVLLEKDVLEREDMVEVLGPRPWADKQALKCLGRLGVLVFKGAYCLQYFKSILEYTRAPLSTLKFPKEA